MSTMDIFMMHFHIIPYQENDSKRTRAEKKAKDESDARKSKNTEISRYSSLQSLKLILLRKQLRTILLVFSETAV